jgi:hypothetical protein
LGTAVAESSDTKASLRGFASIWHFSHHCYLKKFLLTLSLEKAGMQSPAYQGFTFCKHLLKLLNPSKPCLLTFMQDRMARFL